VFVFVFVLAFFEFEGCFGVISLILPQSSDNDILRDLFWWDCHIKLRISANGFWGYYYQQIPHAT